MINKILKSIYFYLYAFHNLIIKNTILKKKETYADVQMDLIALKYLNIKNGFFVDVGCFHPSRLNNTYLMYLKGWRGINIDMNEISIKLFNLVRPGDTNINCAVSEKEGEVSFYTKKELFMSASLKQSDELKIIKKIQSKKLTNIINSSKFKSKPIDFLSVDCEGFDLEVIKTLDFKLYSPKLICIEIPNKNNEDLKTKDTYKYIIDKNYKMIFSNELNAMFAKN
tara:strand:+ start:256 stop:930 length:675 start_codon:yes stop_codon:yes gene_type:complete